MNYPPATWSWPPGRSPDENNAGNYPGYGRDVDLSADVLSSVLTLAAGVGTAQFLGPAPGMLRVVTNVALTALAATPSVTVTLNPGGFVLGRAIAPAAGLVSLGIPAVSFVSGLVLGPGETLDYVNSGAGACTLWTGFYDVPVVNRVLVRAQVSNATPVALIPAAPAGFRRRWMGATFSTNSTPNVRNVLITFNDDTAAVVVSMFLGGVLFVRTGSVAAGAAAGFVGGYYDATVTTGALTMALAGAVATRPINVIACFEQFPT